jgi:tetratricopeptide (TPR) repeat protein
MANRLTAPLRESPATVPALAAFALFIVWATDQAGYPVTHWGPGGLIVLGLLGVAVGVVGLRAAEISLPVRIALGCLAGYTVLSFFSIIWAGVPGDAWEGANRTLLYLLVFALLACWRQRGRTAALLLAAWALAMIGLAAFVALHVNAASSASLQRLLPGGRLIYPSGYANANAAQWLIAFWPALLLSRSARLPWIVRGVLAGGSVLLAEVALLSQSRGSLYATPVMLVLVFALLPQRTRTFAVLVPVAAGIAAAAPAVLHVGNNLSGDSVDAARVHSATAAMLAAAVIVGLVVALAAAVESHRELPASSRPRVRRAIAAIAIATLVAGVVGGWAAAGDPAARVRHAWDTFKSGSGYAANGTGSRLTSGFGSNRYDFYRVALNEFAAHPLVGIGADNFQQQYLAHRRSEETPHYPHSVELRTLAQTGLAGALLALVGLGAALLAGLRACRASVRGGAEALGGDVAAAALGGFAYWAVHGSFDWFWEFAGLGAPAFALLGLACALAPSARRAKADRPATDIGADRLSSSDRSDVAEPDDPIRPNGGAHGRVRQLLGRGRVLGIAAGGVVALAAAASLAAPWLSQLQVQSAARIWTQAPRTAYARLDDAARLNPLSDEAYLLAGTIASRYGDLARADHEFSLAQGRNPGDAYAMLERGAIASMRGERQAALRLLGRALELNPRDPLTRQALQLVRRGRRVSVEALNRSILLKAQQLA